jgi:DMSO/TMAO reductase YedYZ heme-binding membrane subunit
LGGWWGKLRGDEKVWREIKRVVHCAGSLTDIHVSVHVKHIMATPPPPPRPAPPREKT